MAGPAKSSVVGIGSPALPYPPGRVPQGRARRTASAPVVHLRPRTGMPGIEHQRYTPFALSVTQSDGKLTLVVVGELDLESAEKLKHDVTELRPAGTTEIVLDLRQLDFIDSSGLRALLALRDESRGNGNALTLIPPAPTVRRVFEITGTSDLFEWRDDRAKP
jgi:anti-sigma B factor antagonist